MTFDHTAAGADVWPQPAKSTRPSQTPTDSPWLVVETSGSASRESSTCLATLRRLAPASAA